MRGDNGMFTGLEIRERFSVVAPDRLPQSAELICSALLGGLLLPVAAKVTKNACPRIRPAAMRRVPSLRRRSAGTFRRAILGPSELSRRPASKPAAQHLRSAILNGAFECHRIIRCSPDAIRGYGFQLPDFIRATMLNVNRRVDNREALSTKATPGGKAASGVFHPTQAIR